MSAQILVFGYEQINTTFFAFKFGKFLASYLKLAHFKINFGEYADTFLPF